MEREYDVLPESTSNAVEARYADRNGKSDVRTTALTSSLDDLADEEVIQVLEEALDIAEEQSTSPSGSTPFSSTHLTPSLATPISTSPTVIRTPSSSPRTAASFVTLILSIRSRPTYRHILSLIPPHTFRRLLGYLLHLGATHLVHLVLGDILTRSFGRLEIVYQALEVCAGGVEGRYVAEMVEMLDDSYLGGNGERTLSFGTVRRVLELVCEEHGMVSEQRVVRLVEVFAGSIREAKTSDDDIHLLQRTLLRASLSHQRAAVRAIHHILLARKWITDDPSLHTHQDPYNPHIHYTSLGICIALTRSANTSLRTHEALDFLRTAYEQPLVHPHSRLRQAFTAAQDETFRIVLAQRDPRALEGMAEVLAMALSRGISVDRRVVGAFYKACDEARLVGIVRRFVRTLWVHGVDSKARKTETISSVTRESPTSVAQFLPTRRVLAYLLEFMARKDTPWTGDDGRMLGWLLGMLETHPGMMESETAGRCVAAVCALPGGAAVARRVYERLLGNETGPQDDDFALDRLRIGLVTDSRAMIRLVKAYTAIPLKDVTFAQAVVQRYIQHSPPLIHLSSVDLARLTSAFFRIDNPDAGVRMLKYLEDRTSPRLLGPSVSGLDSKAVSVLQGALKTVPHTQGKTYLELLELALRSREMETVPGKRLLDNLFRKGEKAVEGMPEGERQGWRDRLDIQRGQWLERYEKRQNDRR